MRWPRSDPDAYNRCDSSHGRSVPDAGTCANVAAILLQNGTSLIGIHYMLVIAAREIDNTLLFRWDDLPSVKLDDLSWQQRPDGLCMLQASFTGFIALLGNCDGPRYHSYINFRGPIHLAIVDSHPPTLMIAAMWTSTRWIMTPASPAQNLCCEHEIVLESSAQALGYCYALGKEGSAPNSLRWMIAADSDITCQGR